MKIQSFDQFCAERGVSSTPPSFPEYHRAPGGVSKPSKRSAEEKVKLALAVWQSQRNDLHAEYAELYEQGEIRPPTPEELLDAMASEDSEQGQAARRVLHKRKMRLEGRCSCCGLYLATCNAGGIHRDPTPCEGRKARLQEKERVEALIAAFKAAPVRTITHEEAFNLRHSSDFVCVMQYPIGFEPILDGEVGYIGRNRHFPLGTSIVSLEIVERIVAKGGPSIWRI